MAFSPEAQDFLWKFIVFFSLLVYAILFSYFSLAWLKAKINYDPKTSDLRTPLMQPNSLSGMQRTLLLVRGDDIESGLRGKVIEKFEKAGFQLVAMKLAKANESKL